MYVIVENYSGYLSRVAQESSPIKQTVTNLLSESSVYSTSFPLPQGSLEWAVMLYLVYMVIGYSTWSNSIS